MLRLGLLLSQLRPRPVALMSMCLTRQFWRQIFLMLLLRSVLLSQRVSWLLTLQP